MNNKKDSRSPSLLSSYFLKLGIVLLLIINANGCGGIGATTDSSDQDSSDESINTDKLVGTPFEGLTIGDDLKPYLFICDQYQTETIEQFPILVFTAFFTAEEETIIQEGIDIANEGMGFVAYQTTDSWTDDVRVLYKIVQYRTSTTVIGRTYSQARNFNGLFTSQKQNADWAIALTALGTNKWIVAHELGHASGISSHALIDYENDTIIDLEENSLMEANVSSSPVLNDYNYMMSMQGQIMLDHLGEVGELPGSDCDGLKEYYDSLEE